MGLAVALSGCGASTRPVDHVDSSVPADSVPADDAGMVDVGTSAQDSLPVVDAAPMCEAPDTLTMVAFSDGRAPQQLVGMRGGLRVINDCGPCNYRLHLFAGDEGAVRSLEIVVEFDFGFLGGNGPPVDASNYPATGQLRWDGVEHAVEGAAEVRIELAPNCSSGRCIEDYTVGSFEVASVEMTVTGNFELSICDRWVWCEC